MFSCFPQTHLMEQPSVLYLGSKLATSVLLLLLRLHLYLKGLTSPLGPLPSSPLHWPPPQLTSLLDSSLHLLSSKALFPACNLLQCSIPVCFMALPFSPTLCFTCLSLTSSRAGILSTSSGYFPRCLVWYFADSRCLVNIWMNECTLVTYTRQYYSDSRTVSSCVALGACDFSSLPRASASRGPCPSAQALRPQPSPH